jgi:hypothetical protein
MTPTPLAFPISKVAKAVDGNGTLMPETKERYEGLAKKVFEEFEWYLEALKKQRQHGTPYK